MAKLAIDSQNRLRKFVSQDQLAEALGISKTTVRALIARHLLTAVVVAGNVVRIPADEVERFLSARRIGRPFHIPSSAQKATRAQRDHFFPDPDPAESEPERPAPDEPAANPRKHPPAKPPSRAARYSARRRSKRLEKLAQDSSVDIAPL
jgi:excisionase family DNA binding protein